VIERHGDGGSKAEGENESQYGHKGGRLSVPPHKSNIDLKTNKEEIKCDANVAGKDEMGNGGRWEDGVGEVGNTAHD